MKSLKEFENIELLDLLKETVINEITARYKKGRRECRKDKEEILSELSIRDIDTFGLIDDIKQKYFNEIDTNGKQNEDENWAPSKRSKTKIMYIENKGDGINGYGRIGRVSYSKSGKTIYYKNRCLESLSGQGYKANYIDVDTGDHYWISGCKKNGDDTLYPGIIEIDEEVREEYWLTIRNQTENVNLASFRSEGKYSKRKPK